MNNDSLIPKFTETPSYCQATLNIQIRACEELLTLCKDLNRLQLEATEASDQLKKAEKNVQSSYIKKTNDAEKFRYDTKKAIESTFDSLEKSKSTLQACEKRTQDLISGLFAEADTKRINEEIRLAHKPYDDTLRELAIKQNMAQQRIEELRLRLNQCKAELELVSTSIAMFTNGKIPPHVKPILDQVADKAMKDHYTKTAEAKSKITELITAQDTVIQNLAAVNRKIEQAQENAKLLKESQSGDIWKRLSSPVWWNSFLIDYIRIEQVWKAQYESLNIKLSAIAESIVKAKSAHSAILSDKEAIIAAAVFAEQERQYAEYQRQAKLLVEELARAEESVADEHGKIDGIENKKNSILAMRCAAGETAEKREIATIISETATARQDAQSAILMLETDLITLKERMESADSSWENLLKNKDAFLESQLTDHKNREDLATAALNTIQETAKKFVTDNGIELSPPFSCTDVERTRNALVMQLHQAMSDDVAQKESTKSDIQTDSDKTWGTGTTADFRQEVQESKIGKVVGNLYFDFDRYSEDDLSGRGNSDGLRTQLLAIRRKHNNAIFPDLPRDADLLTHFVEYFFPHGFTQSYAVCNLSFVSDNPFLCIRPKSIGPRLEQILPSRLTLAIRVELVDNRIDINNPVLRVVRIEELSDADIRPFEREVTAHVISQSGDVYPRSVRRTNVMTFDFVKSLPLISAKTQERLKDWFSYLNWKERFISAKLAGLRYLKTDFRTNGQYRLVVVAKSKESFENVRSTFRSDELRAFDVDHSSDKWDFQYNDASRMRGIEIGEFTGYEELSPPSDIDVKGIPWDQPFYATVSFRLSDDAQNEYDSMTDNGEGVEEALSHFRSLLPPKGFLALSIVGDLSLVRRQRRELEILQMQSGYAPLLSSYIFDIKTANVPNKLMNIADDQWFRADLNDDQKLAVRKMISTPDLAMVQGPPGTGKTTMIAEAIWQFVRQEKKVLVVSQANLAVDNALERLAHAPAVRAVRLGKKGELNNPFIQANVLQTYYHSIAETCRQRTLDIWNKWDDRLATITKWLADADLLANDIGILRMEEAAVTSDIATGEVELVAYRAEAEQLRDVKSARKEALAFVDFLARDHDWSGRLPDAVLRIYFESVVKAVDKLMEVGIRVNRFWADYDYGHLAEKTKFAVAILREWRKILMALPQIKGDLVRLKATDSETVMAPDDATQLEELNRKLQVAQQAMVDDESKLSEWQSIQKKIREIKRHGSGLDRNLYESVFNGSNGDIPAYLTLTDPKTTRIQMVTLLEKAVSVISTTQEQVTAGLDECRQATEKYVAALNAPQQDPTLIHSLEGRLKELSHKAAELVSQRRDKEARLIQLMKDQLQNQNDKILSFEAFPIVRSAVAQNLQDIQKQIDVSRIFRSDWAPILEKWVSDLTNTETIRSDQVKFLSTYIKSCNVVGVTCTENRRILEEAGHIYFDVVIVDEVSKATPPEIIMPLLMGRTAILVGDHRQLPPLFKEKDCSWEEVVAAQEESNPSGGAPDPSSDLTAENFERFRKMVTSSLFKEHFENAPDSLKSFLLTQYRMHPQIMRVVNQFYENRLVCGLTDPDAQIDGSDARGHRVHGMTLVGAKNQQYLKPDQHVLWIDSMNDPNGSKYFERKDGPGGTVNELEAILIAKCLIDIEKACCLQGYGFGDKKPKQVGIITFYARQVKIIRETVKRIQQLQKCNFKAIKIDINTVDRYQGQERPIIIVSMVRNPTWKLSPRANTAQFERINVAFSRAQELLVVTGAKDVFCSYPVDLPFLDRPGRRKVDVYRIIIDEIQRNGGFWKSDAIINVLEYNQFLPKEKNNHNKLNQSRGRK